MTLSLSELSCRVLNSIHSYLITNYLTLNVQHSDLLDDDFVPNCLPCSLRSLHTIIMVATAAHPRLAHVADLQHLDQPAGHRQDRGLRAGSSALWRRGGADQPRVHMHVPVRDVCVYARVHACTRMHVRLQASVRVRV